MIRRLILIALCGLTFGVGTAAASRPATPAERYAIRHAVAHYRANAVPVTVDTVTILTPQDATTFFGSNDLYAAAIGNTILMSERAAADARALGRAASRPTRKTRVRAFDRCFDQCSAALHAALHEVAHVARSSRMGPDMTWEEGLADAVADDQVRPMLRRLLGTLPTDADATMIAYHDAVDVIRVTSAAAVGASWASAAARRWRLAQLVS